MWSPLREHLSTPLVLSLYSQYAADLRATRAFERDLYLEYSNRRLRGTRGQANPLRSPSLFVPAPVRAWFAAHLPVEMLLQVRRLSKAALAGSDLDPQCDDLNCELAYLLVRCIRPRVVVEISPCGGWSTTWILSALRDTGSGHLYSYDLIDDSTRTVPVSLSKGRWTFVKGDVKQNLSLLPPTIDYLFIDAEHTGRFARWYLEALVPRISQGGIISVDDVFHPANSSDSDDSEPAAVLAWLTQRQIPFFTAAPMESEPAFRAIMSAKAELGMGNQIHWSTVNPSIYFVPSPSGDPTQ